MENFHGSTGYGQKFIDAINGNWGGPPYDDLMLGLDYAEKNYPYIDKDRECALGASYGGYAINWIEPTANGPVSPHCGTKDEGRAGPSASILEAQADGDLELAHLAVLHHAALFHDLEPVHMADGLRRLFHRRPDRFGEAHRRGAYELDFL